MVRMGQIVNRAQADGRMHYFPLGLLMAIQMITTAYMMLRAQFRPATPLTSLTYALVRCVLLWT